MMRSSESNHAEVEDLEVWILESASACESGAIPFGLNIKVFRTNGINVQTAARNELETHSVLK